MKTNNLFYKKFNVPTRSNLKFYFLFCKKFNNKQEQRLNCFKTNRSRGFYKFFNLSRQSIKEFSKREYLPGIIKSSW